MGFEGSIGHSCLIPDFDGAIFSLEWTSLASLRHPRDRSAFQAPFLKQALVPRTARRNGEVPGPPRIANLVLGEALRANLGHCDPVPDTVEQQVEPRFEELEARRNSQPCMIEPHALDLGNGQ